MANATQKSEAGQGRLIGVLVKRGFERSEAYNLAEDIRTMARTDRRMDAEELEGRLGARFDAMGHDIKALGDRVESLRMTVAAQGEHFSRELQGMRDVQATQAQDLRDMLRQESQSRQSEAQALRDLLAKESEARRAETKGLREVLRSETQALRETLRSETQALRETLSVETQALRETLAKESEARRAETKGLREVLRSETQALRDLLAKESEARRSGIDNLRGIVETGYSKHSEEMRQMSTRIDGIISMQHRSLMRIVWTMISGAVAGLLALSSETVRKFFE